MQPLPQELITRALELTGKTLEDVSILCSDTDDDEGYGEYIFSIKNFCFYLLSPEFIEKYFIIWQSTTPIKRTQRNSQFIVTMFGTAVHKYQSGNSKPLIDLLSKI